jgi:triosephosphate isomerase
MKKLIVANWKANCPEISKFKFPTTNDVEIVIAPPAPLLSVPIWPKEISLCAQDISVFNDGPHTGEIPGKSLYKAGVKYVLVGHSETRSQLKNNNDDVFKKYYNTWLNHMTPIVCASDETEIPRELYGEKASVELAGHNFYIMYEPVTAISTPNNYHPENPIRVQETINSWKQKFNFPVKFLYGGSLNPQNIKNYLFADGFVVGQASLNPETFYELLCQIKA